MCGILDKSVCVDCSIEAEERKLNFSQALMFIKHGKTLERISWKDGRYLFHSENQQNLNGKPVKVNVIYLVAPSGILYPYVATQEDLLSDDWIITKKEYK